MISAQNTMSGVRRTIPIALHVLLFVMTFAALHAADPWDRLTTAANRPPAEAEKELNALLLENPTFHAAHYDLGTLILKKDPEAAAAHLLAATMSPNRDLAADAYHNLALARWSQGRLEDALAAEVRAADLNPELAPQRDQMRKAVLVRKDDARLKAEEEARRLKIPNADLPPAFVNEPYDAHVAARGGAGGNRFSADAKTVLPKGLELDPDGRLHGTPSEAKRHQLALQITDSTGATATGTIGLEVRPPPMITTEALPEAVAGQPYRAELAQNGLATPRWTADGLPEGLSIEEGPAATSAIVGTPLAPTAARIAVSALEDPRRADRAYDLIVGDAFAPDVAVLPPATAWAPYTHRVGVRGPALDYRWELSSRMESMAMASDGTLTGTPEKAGTMRVPVRISVPDGRTRTAQLSLPVNPPPVIEEKDPIQLTQGSPAERPLSASGGTPPLAWSLANGELPAGIRLDPDGALRGATAATGDYEITVALKDRWDAGTQQKLKITVAQANDGAKQDQQQPGKKDDQKKDDQKKPDGQDQKPGDQDQAKKPGDDKKPGDESKPGDSKPGDEAKDQQDAKAKQDQQAKDQANQQARDQQRKDQAAKAAKAAKDAKDQKDAGKPGEKPKDQAPSDPAPVAQGKPDPAQEHAQAATARWLETLPIENRAALRDQLLHGQSQTAPRGKPW